MTPEEAVIVLDKLGTAYNREIPGELLEIWAEQGAGVPPEVAIDAVNNCILVYDFFPTFAQFFGEVAAISREKRKDEMLAAYDRPVGPCHLCDGSQWLRTQPYIVMDASTGEKMWANDQWKPCDLCNSMACEQMPRWQRERKKALRHYGPREVEAAHVGAAEARAALART